MRPSPLLLLALVAASAQAEPLPQPLPPPGHAEAVVTPDHAQQELPPPLPETFAEAERTMRDGEAVTIERRGAVTIETYKLNGQISKIRIIPDKGYPYYLIDQNGDGTFEIQRNDLDNPPLNQWRLFEW